MTATTKSFAAGAIIVLILAVTGFIIEQYLRPTPTTPAIVAFTPITISYQDLQSIVDNNGTLHFSFQVTTNNDSVLILLAPSVLKENEKPKDLPYSPVTPNVVTKNQLPIYLDGSAFDRRPDSTLPEDLSINVNHQLYDLLHYNWPGKVDSFRLMPEGDTKFPNYVHYNILPTSNGNAIEVHPSRLLRFDPIPPADAY